MEMIDSTMQDYPLGIQHLFNHGRRVHADSEVITWTEAGPEDVEAVDYHPFTRAGLQVG